MSFFDFEVTYWEERKRPNLLMVNYSDLLADLDGEMRRVSAFLDIPVDEDVWPSLVTAAQFSKCAHLPMRSCPTSNAHGLVVLGPSSTRGPMVAGGKS